MRSFFTKYLGPTVDILEHSTVLAIGIQYMTEHWTNVVVVGVVIGYFVVHSVIKAHSTPKAEV